MSPAAQHAGSLLPGTSRAVDALIARTQSRGRAPSVLVGVLRGGELAHVAGAGTHPEPDPDLQYRIGSISKTLTATLVLRLRDAGRLDLDDRLQRHLPGTPFGALTLRQLLGHTAGLQREPDGAGWWERTAGIDLETLLDGLTPDQVAFRPHQTYHYSNLAYGVLGAMLHRHTGRAWSELVTEELLGPLGMRRTTYHPAEPFARGYVVHPWHDTLREEPRTDTGAMAPAGQLWSTIADLTRWAAFLIDPQPAVLARATLAEMCTPVVISDLASWTAGHGLGLELYRVDDRVFVGHGGSMPGYVAILAVHRPSGTGVVGLANSYGFQHGSIKALGLRVLTTVLDREPVPPQPWSPVTTPPPPEIAPLCGRWWWMGRECQVSWSAEAEELVLTPLGPPGGAPWRFGREADDRWRGRCGPNHGETLTVRRDPTGTPVALDIATFVFTRDPDWPADPR